MTIEMIPLSEFKSDKGTFKHLVKTSTMFGVNYFQATVTVGDKVSIGVSNQIVTHISKLRL